MKKVCVMAVLITIASLPVQAGWRDLLEGLLDEPVTETSLASFTNEEGIAALKQALQQGARFAIEALGQTNGYLGNPKVMIPMPENLTFVESGLRNMGQDKIVDDFINSMNHAAEQAVPHAVDIFVDAIAQMTVNDARAIISGPDDAATQYLRKVGTTPLTTRIKPLVAKATGKVGVTRNYKQLVDKGRFLSRFVDIDKLDLDAYVTDKSLDGLFLMIAEEEQRIRKDPVSRGTDLLKKVFSQ